LTGGARFKDTACFQRFYELVIELVDTGVRTPNADLLAVPLPLTISSWFARRK